ncbi:MATE family efflux transporter [Halalkalibacter urbisdiaboli]|uniref:MATE family efflux transporter n=1 Tax=Halalkalibacter urbisdiaboli TaxID=1960589 RepID=UPI000B451FE5|nr:MATE family efflux transporter [Halalkalibacter urbisdiaboli]
MKNNQLDFTEGNIAKKMFIYAWPIFLSNLLQTSYQLIDSLWVGNLIGATGLGAVAISGTVIFTILSFIIGVNGATLTVLSQRRGANDEKGLKDSLNAFVFVLGGLAILLGLVGFLFSGMILKAMGTPAEIFPMAKTYLRINFIGILFLFGYNFIGTVLRALGDSKTPIRFITVAVLLNTILDPIFIHSFGLGINGAAYATILSQAIAFLYGLFYSIYKAGVPFSTPTLPEKRYFLVLLKMGLPSGLSMMAISAGILAIMSVVTSFGEDAVAGFAAAQRLDSLIMLPALTLGSAVNSMAGQNIGARLWQRVHDIEKQGIILILLVSISISTLIFISAEWLVTMFVQERSTIEFGTLYIKTIAFFYPFLGINFVLNGIVRASGAMVQVLVLNIISFWLLRFPLTFLFASSFGEIGIALGMGTSFVISSFIATCYYFLGNWRNESEKVDEMTRGETAAAKDD